MKNSGFYELKHFEETELKKFFKECIDSANSISIEEMGTSWRRQTYTKGDITVGNCVDKIASRTTHNVFIDRKVQNKDAFEEFESSFTSLHNSKYVFIYLSREQGERIIKKYDLKEKQ